MNKKPLKTELPPLKMPQTEGQLIDSIIAKIHKKEDRALQNRRLLAGIGALLAAIALIPAFRELQREITASGFDRIVSLLFSDSATALAYWKEFSLYLLESLPVLGLAAVLAATFALLSSLSAVARSFSTPFRLRHRSA